MRKLMILVTVLAMAALIGACAEDESTTGPSNPDDLASGEVAATVDGKEWKAQNQIFFNASETLAAAVLEDIQTQKTTTISISFLYDGEEISVGSGTAQCFYQTSEGMPPNATVQSWGDMEGSYEITELTSSHIKGTFEFTGVNEEDDSEKEVKGSFNVPRQ